jgi:hypothetical protein
MIRIRIVQCLCGPARHAIMAMAVMDPEQTDAQVLELVHVAVKEALAGRGAPLGLPNMHPWCGICGAPTRTWMYGVALSREFKDEAEALAALKANEADQRKTAAILDLLDQTYDSKRRTKH